MSMRTLAAFVAVVVVFGATAARTQEADSTKLLAEVRQALGGERALAAVTSFSLEGLGKVASRDRIFTYTLQISCQLPDKFVVVRTQASPGMNVTERDGFNQDEAIRETVFSPPQPPAAPLPGMPKDTPETLAAARREALLANKQRFGALALALIARAFRAYPLEFGDGGTMDVQGSPARVIEAKASGRTVVRLCVNPRTRMPVMVSWHSRPQLVQLPGWLRFMPAPDRDPALSVVVEHQLFLGDYRVINDVMWPHLLVEYVGEESSEELTVAKIKINANIGESRFKVAK
jgi:hypothetical protein